MTHTTFRKLSALIFAFAAIAIGFDALAAGGHGQESDLNFPLPDEHYRALESAKAAASGQELSLIESLKLRAAEDPFNIVATVIFLLAICHTFVAAKFQKMAHKAEHDHDHKIATGIIPMKGEKHPVSFKATLYHFLGEVEAIFGIWLIPLIAAITYMKGGWGYVTHYIDNRTYTEPMVVVVLMAIASSRPVVQAAERVMKVIAGIGKGTPAAYWFSILTIGPILGSFITEPAAMTISAILLGQQFYKLEPSNTFKYATIGLLFVNVSVGGTLTHFAAPPVLMVASTWGWDMAFMFSHFGLEATLGILFANTVYFFIFRKELKELAKKSATKASSKKSEKEDNAPVWIVIVHLAFLAWTIIVLHHPALFIGGFLFFIAFTMATDHHQYQIALKSPMLVGFFLAGLVTHGGLQGWWIAPVLTSLSELPLFIGATLLTAFNDNAAITYLASQVPAFSEPAAAALRHAVVAGAVTGGGLTVIANAPNPAGQSLLAKYFGTDGISPAKLALGALFPTVVMALAFMAF